MFRDTLAMKLRGAYLSMHRAFQVHFSRFGITADQFVVLSLLVQEDGLIQRELVQRTFSDANTLTALLRLLERDGLIRRVRHQNDGRARCVFLTEQGRQLHSRLVHSANQLHQDLLDAVGPDELAVLVKSLDQIQTTMTRLRAERNESSTIKETTP
jgi:DNA-binding MarR family transcriptional regulator